MSSAEWFALSGGLSLTTHLSFIRVEYRAVALCGDHPYDRLILVPSTEQLAQCGVFPYGQFVFVCVCRAQSWLLCAGGLSLTTRLSRSRVEYRAVALCGGYPYDRSMLVPSTELLAQCGVFPYGQFVFVCGCRAQSWLLCARGTFPYDPPPPSAALSSSESV